MEDLVRRVGRVASEILLQNRLDDLLSVVASGMSYSGSMRASGVRGPGSTPGIPTLR